MKWTCPNCRQPLLQEAHSLVCESGHCFDVAREGYVNLLPANRKHSKEPGDNREMIDARRRVHQAQLYRPLAEKIAEVMQPLAVADALVLDLGCGEGYYSGVLLESMAGILIHAVDISKPAVRLAAKACQAGHFAVASAFDVPLADTSVDAAFSVFAPTDDKELARLITPGGYFLDVSPAPSHLWELRQLLYDNPRQHEPALRHLPLFEHQASEQLSFRLMLAGEELADLIAMTPYAYGGQRENKKKLAQLDSLELQVSFALGLFRRLPD